MKIYNIADTVIVKIDEKTKKKGYVMSDSGGPSLEVMIQGIGVVGVRRENVEGTD
jgi:hypothetical protein